MNGNDLLQGWNHIDETYIEEAETVIPDRSFRKSLAWFGGAAAVLCVFLWSGMAPFLFGGAGSVPEEQFMQGPSGGDGYDPWSGNDRLTGEVMDGEPPMPTTEGDALDGYAEPGSYLVSAQYIRTDAGMDGADFPCTELITSAAELESYCGRLEDYDDAYFAENNLLLIAVEEPSGSIRHQVVDLGFDTQAESWIVTIQRAVPAERTDDMAVWNILISVQTGAVIQEDDAIAVRFVTEVEEG